MFQDSADEYTIVPAVRPSLIMRPCANTPRDGDDCYSVYRAGTDMCLYAHITYAQAHRHVYGCWPDEEEKEAN